MPTKKTTKKSPPRKKSSTINKIQPEFLNSDANMSTETSSATAPKRPVSTALLILPLLIALLVLILWRNKGWVVAATVNNQPIWRWELEERFVSRYGSQTLDEIINEQILKNEAAKQNIQVTDKDVDQKIAEIEKSLEGRISLKDALAQQGMTIEQFRDQAKIQILIDKLTEKKVNVSDKEIDEYIEKNKDALTATEAGAIREEAKEQILQDKKRQVFQDLFGKLKKDAKVSKFL